MQKPPVESSGVAGEPFPPTPVAAITCDLRRSEKPQGRAGKATPVLDLPKDLGTGEAGAEDRREGEGETNGAVVIGEKPRTQSPARGGCRGCLGVDGGVATRVGVCEVRALSWAFALGLCTVRWLFP